MTLTSLTPKAPKLSRNWPQIPQTPPLDHYKTYKTSTKPPFSHKTPIFIVFLSFVDVKLPQHKLYKTTTKPLRNLYKTSRFELYKTQKTQ